LHDELHEASGAYWLTNWFGPEVTEPVRLHVAAKRFLCFAQPSYWESLSDASKHSLELQGGVFDDRAAKLFLAEPYAADAVQLRRWDDLAKRKGWPTSPLAVYRPLLERLCLESLAA
jgi:gamma-butyrobetaine dioxygenase